MWELIIDAIQRDSVVNAVSLVLGAILGASGAVIVGLIDSNTQRKIATEERLFSARIGIYLESFELLQRWFVGLDRKDINEIPLTNKETSGKFYYTLSRLALTTSNKTSKELVPLFSHLQKAMKKPLSDEQAFKEVKSEVIERALISMRNDMSFHKK